MVADEDLTLDLVQDQLRAALNDRIKLNTAYRDSARAAADAEATFKVAFARERWAAKSADGKKVNDTTAEDIARDATDDLYRIYLSADAERDIMKQALFANSERQQTLRTLASSYRMLELGGN